MSTYEKCSYAICCKGNHVQTGPVCYMYLLGKENVLINEERFYDYIQVTFTNDIILVHLSNEFSEPNLDFNCS